MPLTQDDLLPLMQRYYRNLQMTEMTFSRYLYSQINWDARLIGIKGARGVGKSTLILQRIKEFHQNPDEAIYASLDDLWFSTFSLPDLVEYLYSRGVRHFYFDEVHKYPEWSRILKNLYDSYPDIKIVYTGSALLAIDHSVADLSRRQSLYTLHGMSFREYLEYEGLLKMPPISLNELLSGHVAISMEINSKIPVLKYFDDYLRHGVYPFYKENPTEYILRLSEVVRQVIEGDIPETEDISITTISKLKTMMMTMAESAPLEPNISKLAEKLDCSRELCLKMLYLLDKATLLQLMFYKPKSYKQIRGPKKVLGGDSNILYALTATTNVGTLRETFFVNQLSAVGEIVMAEQGDYKVDGKYTFEIGGSGKKFTQIADIPDSYLAVDNIATGYGARIPLYLFGFLY